MKAVAETIAVPAVNAAGLAVVLFFEWHTDEPMVVLPVLLITCFVAGLLAPRNFLLTGLTLGWAILVAHSVSNATGVLVPRYQHEAPAPTDWLAMALLVLPALGATFAGSRVPSLVGRTG